MTREAGAATRVAAKASALSGAGAGAASAVLGAGVGELVAALVAPSSSPFSVVGGVLIDLAPPWAKDAAISLFGTADKLALLVGIALVLLVAAAGVGILELRRPWFGAALFAVLGAVVAVLAMTRAGATGLAWLPSLAAGLVAATVVRLLTQLARRTTDASSPASTAAGTGDAPGDDDPSRRRFLVWAGAATAAGVIAAIAGTALQAGSRTVTAVRRALRLPAPAVAAPPVPADAQLDLTGMTPVVTPNASFYRIDTALVVPQVDPSDWSLRIHGLVENEVEIGWDELLALPLEESWTTLACVSNPVGGDLIGNAKWLGYPIRLLLERARPTSDADMVLSRSIDGFTASTPLEVLQEESRAAILALGMNDEPLPAEHGFPVRMVVPGLYGYVSATKWVTELEVTRFDKATAYWTTRGWSAKGPIKLQSRIDLPRRGQGLSAGDTTIAGVAWQQHVGIAKVEVQVDGGPWREATLASAISDDTWVQWSIPWTAERGSHAIRCRATNVKGERQTETDAWPAPDGATGWQQLNVEVA
ncbi:MULTISPECIES: molybdopterin-dependent oxidoreductase [Microbacterium]|uniref:Sulfoxide reductase catalytic subunit YedY n=1 Tax=Microbacterium trichothecenolyticum TaxID=69370 RepID=A0A0M2H644_MICTR|nr:MULTISPECIES: molybdopterin-dependent oxidoreductase [Microbacterium]KJL41811.1 Sulfoxide reductase catalytic subunit YedY precursor [Microbacterium trichothecenolyticum]MDR7187568.1 DMSO/TMAO reductase YedYZ molybdopterin-dependent catalytic subunit [Microbacterium sp. BE35]